MEKENKNTLIISIIILVLLLGVGIFYFWEKKPNQEKKVATPTQNIGKISKETQKPKLKEEKPYTFNKEEFKKAEKGLLEMKNNTNLGEGTKNLIEVFESNLPEEDKASFWYLSYGYNFVKLINKLDKNSIKMYCDGLFKATKNSDVYIINPTGEYKVNDIISIKDPKAFFEKVSKDLENSNIDKNNPYIKAINKCLSVY